NHDTRPSCYISLTATMVPFPAAWQNVGMNLLIHMALLLTATPAFYKDVSPILQQHCQQCHRPGQIGPMPLITYSQTRARAKSIAQMVRSKKMPPWFADSRVGHFANDPSLTDAEIQTITSWVDGKTPAGDRHDAPPPRQWTEGWNIPKPDRVIQMPKPVAIPARGDVEYTYEIVPTGFTEDKWVQM